jgi:1-acyl-sn-glycerol-3-phosphate acyltransferase
MHVTTPERIARARRFAGMRPLLRGSGPRGAMLFWHSDGTGVTRRLRAVWRSLAVVLWTLPAIPIQGVLLLAPAWGGLSRGKVVFARIYWATLCRLLGLRVRLIGRPAASLRPVVYVSNHSSWLDVPVLGGQLEACFIAKAEVERWPVVRTVARLGRTLFVSRRTSSTARERDAIRARLDGGDDLILFPEGTTSDGSRVLPFRSAFFAVAEGAAPPLIQPVSVVYDRLAGLPIGRASRPLFAWYGDMDIASHFWRLAQHGGLRVTVLLHAPIDPALFADRKALSAAVWSTVADGAATLRQNRPVRALPEVAAPVAAEPAYA